MSSIEELGSFLARQAAAARTPPRSTAPAAAPAGIEQGPNGAPAAGQDQRLG